MSVESSFPHQIFPCEGLICIRSGDDSPADQATYFSCGAHCCFGKDITKWSSTFEFNVRTQKMLIPNRLLFYHGKSAADGWLGSFLIMTRGGHPDHLP